ncbi:MAG TPA: zinc-dependent metalloprotease [Chryseosolibacter sp.]|nr:zinc-dependent metalloprotease [Chryseosolibacter sp.]
MRVFCLSIVVLFSSSAAVAQTLEALTRLSQDTLKRDSIKRETPASVPAGNEQLSAPRNFYNLMRNRQVLRKGLFSVHKVADNYYFEIPDSILGRDLLVVARIAQGAAGVRPGYTGYAGDQIGSTIIRFEKGPGHKLFLRRITYEEQAGDTTDAMYHAVVRSNLQPLVAAFGIGAYSPSGKGSVIDVTSYINGDNDIFFFNTATRKSMRVGSLQNNMCYIQDINAYPMNVEIRTIKTYTQSSSRATFTMELNTSIVLLPEVPMRKRLSDKRIGYFTERYTDYDANPHGVKVVSFIKRWRLEPKPEDVERYKKGELVEPRKPIVYYIDPATPKKWVPYLIRGIEDWQQAFERAGFKNAIQARTAPKMGESVWSLEDSRHSAIVYKPSSFANAAGPVITDPRSGEILESHINWYHNLMSILRNWYLIQCGPTDPRAQKMQFDDPLMGELIRSVAAHEVGHTLGLTHNFGASSTVPVEKLRDRDWLERNGHTPSIMDYARFNYVAQPEDSVGERGLISRIGAYDLWAIEWGYRWYPDLKSPEEEKPILNQWIVEKMEDDRALWYGSEFSSDDPRTQTEDLGNNAMKAGEYGIINLKRVVSNLMDWTYKENEGYHDLHDLYNGVLRQFDYYVGHVLANIGGIYETPKLASQPGPVYQMVPLETQKGAMEFIKANVFATPTWLLDTMILARVGESPTETIGRAQEKVLNTLLGTKTVSRLAANEAMHGEKAYRLIDYFNDIDHAMWTELEDEKTIDLYRRNLQRAYIEELITLSDKSGKEYRDVGPIVKNKLTEIHAVVRKAVRKIDDPMSQYHLKFIEGRLAEVNKE